ncbi:MAG: MarR family winged helix-turn-helix transcriptional regulator [Dehalococcoidia bacterium]
MVFALKRAYLAARRSLDDRLAPHGLTATQTEILVHLDRHGRLEQRRLQAAIGVTSATLTRILDGMTSRGFVERETMQRDSRANWVVLTPTGRERLHALKPLLAAFMEDLRRGFSDAEAVLLTEWLLRVAASMGDESARDL